MEEEEVVVVEVAPQPLQVQAAEVGEEEAVAEEVALP